MTPIEKKQQDLLLRIDSKIDHLDKKLDRIEAKARRAGAVSGAVAGGLSGGLVATGISLIKSQLGL